MDLQTELPAEAHPAEGYWLEEKVNVQMVKYLPSVNIIIIIIIIIITQFLFINVKT
jgi:hypothetical protein